MKLVRFLAIFALICAFGNAKDFEADAKIIREMLDKSIAVYKNGDNLSAKKLAEDAYFQHFENIEGHIGRNMGKKAYLMERRFTNLRKLYQNKANPQSNDLERIEALIAGLYFDMDEVLPILKGGIRLVAEASDTTYDKAKAEADSIKAEAQRRKEAEAMFAALLGDTGESSANSSESSVDSANAESNTHPLAPSAREGEQNADSAIGAQSSAEFQQAAGLNPKLYFIYENISAKLDIAAMRFQKGEIESAANLIESAQFDDYRNTKLEIAINKVSDKGNKIQQSMRQITREIREKSIDEKRLREEITDLSDELFDILLTITPEQIALVQVKGFDESAVTKDYAKVADDIKIALNNILDSYQNKGAKTLIDALQSAYLDIFEGSGMENKIGAMNADLKMKIEAQFTRGVALIKADAPKDDLQKTFDELNKLIASSLDFIQDSSVWFLFISALSIILREGLEAMLIVVAIVAYLIQSGNSNRTNIVYSALGVGVFLSFVTAFAVYYFFREYAGQFRELLEGVTMLVAVALLLYVGFWLLSKAHKWNEFIKHSAKEAISKGSSYALWWTVFLAVYREGAETVLFYQALLFDSNTSADFSAVIGGLALGCIILVVLYLLIKRGAVKIPIKLFFQATSAIIFLMCFSFSGKGVGELIEGKVLTPTLIPYQFDAISWAGLYPYYESLGLQAIVVCFIIGGIIATRKLSQKGEKSPKTGGANA
ncbi:FTR1 family iron permease [Helicobacter sp. 23-1045]